MKEEFTILLYYKYVKIENPLEYKDFQLELCQKLNLKGRIIVAEEGINGTVEGLKENTELYIEEMKKDPRFSDMSFKKSVGTGNAFPRLSVKARKEIVSLHLDSDIDPNQLTGKRIKAKDLKDWYESGKEFYIVDMRNDYEYKVGRFKDSILLPVENFREIPKHLDSIAHLKDKTVLPVCTGGVRCEKASGLLLREGFKDVYQIEDGMVSFIENFPNQEFEGSLYVFDGRITVTYDDKDKHKVVGECSVCQSPTEIFSNCANKSCNKKMLCCSDCLPNKDTMYCSEECEKVMSGKNLVKLNE